MQIQNAVLRRQCLDFKEVLGGSLGCMGLSGTVIIGIPIVVDKSGPSTPFIFLTAMFAFLLVAAQINVFAKRIATHGSLCDFVKSVFGARAGAVAGWLLVVGYVASVPAYLASVPYALIGMVHGVGGTMEPEGGELVAAAVAISVLALWLAVSNVMISTRAILTVEVLSLGLLALVIGRYWPEPRVLFAGIPTDFDGVRHVLPGLALAMVCFTGFEAASVFGTEAKQPLTMVPKANWATVLVTGAVIFTASGAVIGALHVLQPEQNENFFAALVRANGLQYGVPLVLGISALSWFGCLLACLNTGGRLLYTLALQGYFLKGIGFIHPRFATPFIAMSLIATVGLAATSALILCGADAMDILIGAVSVAAIGFLIGYALVSAAAVVDRWRHAKRYWKIVYALPGVLAIVLMLFPIAGLIIGPD